MADQNTTNLSEPQRWQPIGTAPKDGTPFMGRSSYAEQYTGKLRYHRRITRWGKASHVPLYGWIYGQNAENINLWEPELWQPLAVKEVANAS